MGAKTWIAGGAVALAAALAGCERQSWDTVKEFHRHHGSHEAHGHAEDHAEEKGSKEHPAPHGDGHAAPKPAAPAPH